MDNKADSDDSDSEEAAAEERELYEALDYIQDRRLVILDQAQDAIDVATAKTEQGIVPGEELINIINALKHRRNGLLRDILEDKTRLLAYHRGKRKKRRAAAKAAGTVKNSSSSEYLVKVREARAEEVRKLREASAAEEETWRKEREDSGIVEEDAVIEASDVAVEDAVPDAAGDVDESKEAAAEEKMRVAARALEDANRSDEEDEEVPAPRGRKRKKTTKSAGRKATQKRQQKLKRLELNLFRSYYYITK